MEISKKDWDALNILQEECAEIIQAISKIRRFGLHSVNPYDSRQRRINWRRISGAEMRVSF